MASIGIQVPNGTPEGADRTAMLNSLYSVGYQAYLGMQADVEILREAKRRYPNAIIQLRWYDTNILEKDPVALADEIAAWHTNQGRFIEHHATGNELNNPGEGLPDGASGAQVDAWLIPHYTRLRQVAPWLKLHFPAFGTSLHSDDDLNLIRQCRGSITLCDYFDAHCYGEGKYSQVGDPPYYVPNPAWDPNWPTNTNYGARYKRYEQVLNEMGFSSLPIPITEFNRIWYDPDWYNRLPPGAKPGLPPPEDEGSAYAQEVAQFYNALKSDARVPYATGFIFASHSVQFWAMSWWRFTEEPVVAMERSLLGGGPPPPPPGPSVTYTFAPQAPQVNEAVAVKVQSTAPGGDWGYVALQVKPPSGATLAPDLYLIEGSDPGPYAWYFRFTPVQQGAYQVTFTTHNGSVVYPSTTLTVGTAPPIPPKSSVSIGYTPSQPYINGLVSVEVRSLAPGGDWGYIGLAVRPPSGISYMARYLGLSGIAPGPFLWRFEFTPSEEGKHTLTFSTQQGAEVAGAVDLNVGLAPPVQAGMGGLALLAGAAVIGGALLLQGRRGKGGTPP